MAHPPASQPLRRVTLNLFEADCLFLEAEHGYGWTEKVRELVHAHTKRKPTVEDFLRKTGHINDH